jgi:hypothetical protein
MPGRRPIRSEDTEDTEEDFVYKYPLDYHENLSMHEWHELMDKQDRRRRQVTVWAARIQGFATGILSAVACIVLYMII